MSAVMATDDLLKKYLVEETSCGPLCQHPQCWASNRRVERGLPRLRDSLQSPWTASADEGALPTLKVQNLLAESGLGGRDDYTPAQQPSHHRSSSAPAVDLDNRPQQKFPYTPYTSPMGVRSTSAQSLPSPLQGRQPAKAKSVEVRELFDMDELSSDWQKTFVPSRVYVWCPSKKAYERQLRKEGSQTPATNDQNDSSKPVTLKDMTDLMVPEAPKDKTKRTKKMKKKPSRITPTGGRPYTHPSRSPPATRRAQPADMDESIAQLLTLPRDILMDVLVHIRNSDSLDKQKVQLLLSRLMPLIHFDANQPQHRSLSPTPLLASGILQNKKMSLLTPQGGGGAGRHGAQPQAGTAAGCQRNPFYLDDGLVAAMTASTYSGLAQQLPMEEGEGGVASEEEVKPSGRMAHQRPLGPISVGVGRKVVGAVPESPQIRNKLTSVSTKSLPPLVPGAKPTKPFDYKGTKSLDLTLGPLPSPDHHSPEKPSTPRSAKASTLYVTLPSVLSPDRTEMTTPLQPYGRVSGPGHAERFANQYLHDTPSPIASEDFPELFWFDNEHPLHAVSPSLSTGVPKAPLGTPATNIHQPYKPLSASQHRPGRSPSPTKQAAGTPHREINPTSAPADPLNADALGTIREVHSELPTSYPGTSAMDTSLPTSPMKHGVTPVSTPWGNCTSITTGALSEGAGRSPVPPLTPQPSTATPEPWPVVDERDFMTSPEKPRDAAPCQAVNLATPTAPPPSPEPQELKNEFEFAVNDMSKSGMTSLTPLVEEGEEEDEEEEVDVGWGKMKEAASPSEDLKDSVEEGPRKTEDIKGDAESKTEKGAFMREDTKEDTESKIGEDASKSEDIIGVKSKVEESAQKSENVKENESNINQEGVSKCEDAKEAVGSEINETGTQETKPEIEGQTHQSAGGVLPCSENDHLMTTCDVTKKDGAAGPDPDTGGEIAAGLLETGGGNSLREAGLAKETPEVQMDKDSSPRTSSQTEQNSAAEVAGDSETVLPTGSPVANDTGRETDDNEGSHDAPGLPDSDPIPDGQDAGITTEHQEDADKDDDVPPNTQVVERLDTTDMSKDEGKTLLDSDRGVDWGREQVQEDNCSSPAECHNAENDQNTGINSHEIPREVKETPAGDADPVNDTEGQISDLGMGITDC
ncbi:uncharacterized protein LOC110976405 isoform X2 [Acanthaster planci]|uniref:Uncharacterized protein LOC110976405 isoform X2 n=1 Tax=Acanthaster planci TaxID=133434 RepID=A0A8B7XZ72_ACAPL|nr:uncharacterized protein LOC110976405 isoform X2 [Acanthaster planci]